MDVGRKKGHTNRQSDGLTASVIYALRVYIYTHTYLYVCVGGDAARECLCFLALTPIDPGNGEFQQRKCLKHIWNEDNVLICETVSSFHLHRRSLSPINIQRY